MYEPRLLNQHHLIFSTLQLITLITLLIDSAWHLQVRPATRAAHYTSYHRAFCWSIKCPHSAPNCLPGTSANTNFVKPSEDWNHRRKPCGERYGYVAIDRPTPNSYSHCLCQACGGRLMVGSVGTMDSSGGSDGDATGGDT